MVAQRRVDVCVGKSVAQQFGDVADGDVNFLRVQQRVGNVRHVVPATQQRKNLVRNCKLTFQSKNSLIGLSTASESDIFVPCWHSTWCQVD